MKFTLIRKSQAYIMWHIYNDFKPAIETTMALERNLELIMSDEMDILAYRYDLPTDMTHLVMDYGKWHLTREGKELGEFHLNRLRLLCRDYTMN